MKDLFDGYEKILFLENDTLLDGDLTGIFNGEISKNAPFGKMIFMTENNDLGRMQITKILSFGKILPKDFLWWKMAQNSAFYEYLITK